MSALQCRSCGAPLARLFCDLGVSPVSNAFLRPEDLARMEPFYPLRAFVCDACLLVQLEQFEPPERIFGDDYAYFSSYSDSWLEHCRVFADSISRRLDLGARSLVVEVASNDGYLLQYFRERGIPVLGIEPAANVAAAAEERGVPTVVEFFGTALARRLALEGKRADLLVGNNVLAHVPALNDFVAGLRILLAPQGTIAMEFPHLLNLVRETQFDTIYHEHFSYFSLAAAERVLRAHELEVYDVDEIPTHGGSLRVHACHRGAKSPGPRVAALQRKEAEAGLDRLETYTGFDEKVKRVKRELLEFLIAAKRAGRQIVGYGAPAKGNTLLNYCGIRGDFLDYTVDRSPHKQGRFLPGTRIPIQHPDRIRETRPDYILILPWNLREEIVAQLAYARVWGAKFVVPIPTVTVIE